MTLCALDFGNQVSLFSTLLVAGIVDSFPHLLFVCLSLCVRARVHVTGLSLGLTVLTSNIDIN